MTEMMKKLQKTGIVPVVVLENADDALPLAERSALADGTLSPERWELYNRLERENSRSRIKKNEKMMHIAMDRRKQRKRQ